MLQPFDMRETGWNRTRIDYYPCITNEPTNQVLVNKVTLNSSSMFSGNLDRTIMDFLNDEEELLITFEKDTVEDAYTAAKEDAPLVNMKITPNLTELEASIDKEYGGITATYSQRIHLQLANVLLFMALLITLKLVLIVLNNQ